MNLSMSTITLRAFSGLAQQVILDTKSTIQTNMHQPSPCCGRLKSPNFIKYLFFNVGIFCCYREIH